MERFSIMINNISLVSVLFDYPQYYMPAYYNNINNTIDKSDIHILRFSALITGSRYDKLYFYKIPKLLEYLQLCSNLKEYILFLDATDTNFYRCPNNIVRDFLQYNCNILFCGDPNIWPRTSDSKYYLEKPILSKYCYLNSGAYMGKTQCVIDKLKILSDIRPYGSLLDDQAHWTHLYLTDKNNDIAIDQNRSIFFSTLEAKEDIVFTNNKPIISTNPYIIHDNGPHNNNTIKLTQILSK